MRIALDYDGTYTADQEFWDDFIRRTLAAGHSIDIVTMRGGKVPIPVSFVNLGVIYTGGRAKQPFCKTHGISFDIWIDDNPYQILNDPVRL